MRGLTRQERLARAASPAAQPLEAPPPPLQHAVTDPRQLLTVPWIMWFRWLTGRGLAHYLQGTHAERVEPDANGDPVVDPADYIPGTWFWEEDRTVLYQVRIVEEGAAPPEVKAVWMYAAGTMRGTLAAKPADLGIYDTGFLFFGTGSLHTWRWTGSAWEYAPGDRASGEIAFFSADPGTGWLLCNGQSGTRTLPSAGTAVFTTPNLIGRYAKGAAAYTGAAVAGTGPGLTGQTADESAHTHSGASLTTSAANVTTPGAGAPATFNAADGGHGHSISGNTGAGTAHRHGAGTLTADGTGEPAHVDLLPYFRL